MTLSMPDSVTVADLPDGYPAYLGYADGRWPTAETLKQRFTRAEILTLTVLGGHAVADGCDIETGDLTPASGAAYLHGQIQAGVWRPAGYASVGSMPWVLEELAALGVQRAQVRVFTAHYGKGQHICGPKTCGELDVDADGTQYSDSFPGLNGSVIDMSVLADDFFGAVATPTPAPTANWPAGMILREGSTGGAVEVLQRALRDSGIVGVRGIAVDGDFGPQTLTSVRNFQAAKHLAVDGIAGPMTRAALGV